MEPTQSRSRRYFLILSLSALGVVYGDIGTSPLYAIKECFDTKHGVAPTPQNVYGILSLIFWSLVIVISLKYLVFVMRAGNRGEGGILALMSLVRPRGERRSVRRGLLFMLGLFGAALLYGDGMITPAISVLGAIEGLSVATPVLSGWVIPVTLVVLFLLFVVQQSGTARVGAMFGPIMFVWFVTIAGLGVWQIIHEPHVLRALLPNYAYEFFVINRVHGFLVLGAVFLVVTGGEALYADMGHFGVKPIRVAWFTVVFPALVLNYFGQGAVLLRLPVEARDNPFFYMAPAWGRIPLVILATVAAAIASQAVISGAFSLTRQAVQLGYLPRIRIRHTSARQIGQIYIPSVNWLLAISAMGLVATFQESTSLAAAYGVAVTATMAITTILFATVARERWRWSVPATLAFLIPFLAVDLAFFGANIVKFMHGGWFPLAVGVAVFTVMSTWRKGRTVLTNRLKEQAISTEDLLRDLASNRIPRVPGTAIFMTRDVEGIPTTILHNIKHNKVVHQKVVFLTVETEETPHLSPEERFEWRDLGQGVYRLIIRFGFMEDSDIPELLAGLENAPVSFNPMTTSYFLGRETLIPTHRPGMAIWREHLFAWMMRNATSASTFFSLPPNQVIELGAQVEI
ncbi:MAG TPA: potassium transporter Kup [Thermoanaerobaculia bacterium]|nr:potassium transporter Kup [Thermoanaerobaculia bacterium]